MCTVTYIWNGRQTVITSNRDEHASRPASIHPQVYLVNCKKVIFPKDPKAGGTWFAVDEDANVAVLLNGAETRHEPEKTYRKSRGLVLLDILTDRLPLEAWKNYDTRGIEAFTIILLWQNDLYQLRWNAKTKETLALNAKSAYIWSSCTLYTPTMQRERETWFDGFLTEWGTGAEAMKDFHLQTGEENTEGLVINRGDKMKTLSVTQTVIERNKADLFHYDLLDESSFVNSFVII